MKKTISILAVIILIAACKKNSTPIPPPITDIDGNVYDTVTIGGQLWMKVNLNTTRYRNGDLIPKVTDPVAWTALITGAWCWYNNDSATYAATYGKLYNWFAVNDPRGLAPAGWHVPSDAEWTTLSTGLGGDLVAGGALKETSTTHWTAPNTGATNSSGFTGLPGGFQYDVGTFFDIGVSGNWWSSTENNVTNGGLCYLNYGNGFIGRSYNIKRFGFSVRCVKD